MASPAYDPDDDDRPRAEPEDPTRAAPTDGPWSIEPPPIPAYLPSLHGDGPEDDVPTSPPTPLVRPADWGERVGATLVDWAILFAALLVTMMMGAVSDVLGTLGGLAWFGLAGYLAWLNGSKGQSPGKSVLGLRVVRDDDGSTLGGPVGLVRALVLLIMFTFTGGLLAVLAMLWPVWDPRRQALHDKTVGASVLAGFPRATLGRDIFLP